MYTLKKKYSLNINLREKKKSLNSFHSKQLQTESKEYKLEIFFFFDDLQHVYVHIFLKGMHRFLWYIGFFFCLFLDRLDSHIINLNCM